MIENIGLFQEQNLLSPPPGYSFQDPRIVALNGNNNRSAFKLSAQYPMGEALAI